MSKSLIEVLSPSIIPQALNESMATNGNWVPVVDGVVIPGVTAVVDAPVELNYANIQTDARRQPDARLRYYQEGNKVTLRCTTEQAGVLDQLLGMGAQRYDMADTNTNRTIGAGGSLATDPDGAEWYLVKIGDGSILSTTWSVGFSIARTMFSDLSAATADWKAQVYVPDSTPPASFAAGTDVIDIDAEATLADAYLGNFVFAAVDQTKLVAAALMVYDPADIYTVKTSGITRVVDFIDPLLEAGDQCAIIGLGYKFGQLSGANDYSIVCPWGQRRTCFLDLYMCLGDADEGNQWKRRRYYRAEQSNIPNASTDGSSTEVNTIDYEFLVMDNISRFRTGDTMGRLYEEDYLFF